MSEPRRWWVKLKNGHAITLTANKPKEAQIRADRIMYGYEYVQVQEIQPKESK